jgi:pilus assembly protein CpaF
MEVVGMEGDTITTQELFSFQFQGRSADGMLRRFSNRMVFARISLPRAEYYGLDRPLLEVI